MSIKSSHIFSSIILARKQLCCKTVCKHVPWQRSRHWNCSLFVPIVFNKHQLCHQCMSIKSSHIFPSVALARKRLCLKTLCKYVFWQRSHQLNCSLCIPIVFNKQTLCLETCMFCLLVSDSISHQIAVGKWLMMHFVAVCPFYVSILIDSHEK